MMTGSSFRQTKRRRTTSKASGGSSVVPVSAARAESNLARKVVRLEKVVRGLKPELKAFTASTSFANVADTVGAITSLVPIAAGTNFTDRIGDKIRIKRIYCRVRVSTGSGSIGASPTDEEFSRFAIVQDLQGIQSTDPVVSNIVYAVASPQDALPNISGFPGRFKWLWVSPLMCHARISNTNVQGALTVPYAPTQSPVAVCDKAVDIPVTFHSTASSNTLSNPIYLICWTNLAADTLDVDFTYRTSFIDV